MTRHRVQIDCLIAHPLNVKCQLTRIALPERHVAEHRTKIPPKT